MGQLSWQESVQEVEDSLNFLRKTLRTLPASARPSVVQVAELKRLNRRIRLLAYAQSRAQDAGHRAWADEVRSEMSGEVTSGAISYSPEELRERARVS